MEPACCYTDMRWGLHATQVFGHSLEMKMQKILNFLLKELGCNISEARAIVLSQPHVFSYSREKNLLPKVLMDQWVSPACGDGTK